MKSLNFHFKWFISLLVLEAVLSLIDLSQISFVNVISKDLSEIFPVVMNFNGETKPFQIARNYIAITILFFPAKAFFGYIWLQNRRGEILKTVIVSPYSENRSVFSKVFFLIGVFAITFGATWYVLWGFGNESFHDANQSLLSQHNKYSMVLKNGLSMWVSWALMHMTILGFAWSVFIQIIKDWLEYLGILSTKE